MSTLSIQKNRMRKLTKIVTCETARYWAMITYELEVYARIGHLDYNERKYVWLYLAMFAGALFSASFRSKSKTYVDPLIWFEITTSLVVLNFGMNKMFALFDDSFYLLGVFVLLACLVLSCSFLILACLIYGLTNAPIASLKPKNVFFTFDGVDKFDQTTDGPVSTTIVLVRVEKDKKKSTKRKSR